MRDNKIAHCYVTSLVYFLCGKCGERKPTTGRKLYKVKDIDSMGRKNGSWQCEACAKVQGLP